MKKTLILNSPSRIHLGFIQLDKSSSRIFGSLGLTISSFNNNIVIKESKKFNIESESLEISRKVTKILKLISQKKKSNQLILISKISYPLTKVLVQEPNYPSQLDF